MLTTFRSRSSDYDRGYAAPVRDDYYRRDPYYESYREPVARGAALIFWMKLMSCFSCWKQLLICLDIVLVLVRTLCGRALRLRSKATTSSGALPSRPCRLRVRCPCLLLVSSLLSKLLMFEERQQFTVLSASRAEPRGAYRERSRDDRGPPPPREDRYREERAPPVREPRYRDDRPPLRDDRPPLRDDRPPLRDDRPPLREERPPREGRYQDSAEGESVPVLISEARLIYFGFHSSASTSLE